MKLIVAVDEKWGIGKNGDLLLSIPDDMMYYRMTTRGKVVVMGYTTLLSLPKSKPAPGRLNLVLADIEGLRIPGAVVCGSMEQLLRLIGCFRPDDVFDVGGGSMYRQLMPYCSDAHITKMRFDGEADTFIPNLDELGGWSIAGESELKDHEGLKYSFVVYHNDSPKPLKTAQELSTDMSAYFKKKEPLEIKVIENEEYKDELKKLVRAYFCPFEKGLSADEVAEYLDGDNGAFETYLREKRRIATVEDISALSEKYGLNDAKARSVTVDKENLDAIDGI
ncbi:MAG: dihydrofolate reductase [Ruminococcus sp.]|nr:dihydrofolate reductase [Ruminococcus sp.]